MSGIQEQENQNPVKTRSLVTKESTSNLLEESSIENMLKSKLDDKVKDNIKVKDNEIIQKKRKSKFTIEGRNYKCEKCEKAYLSYPALYIHIKTKHEIDGNSLLSKNEDKKKGRPKKNVNMNQKQSEEKFDDSEESKSQERPQEIVNPTVTPVPCIFNIVETFEDLKKYFKISYKDVSNHPFYKILNHFNNQNLSIIQYSNQYLNILKNETLELKNVSSSLFTKNCSYIFCEYLNEISKIMDLTEYMKNIKFVFLFHDFYNEYSYKREYPEEKNSQSNFCDIFQAESLPNSCNDFVMDYVIKLPASVLDIKESIDLIQKFCKWLFEKKYTTLTISLL